MGTPAEEQEFWRSITLAEEDLRASHRGSYHRWFRSENVIDLVPLIRSRRNKQPAIA